MRARALAFAYRFSSGVRVSWASSTAFATLGTAVVTLLVLPLLDVLFDVLMGSDLSAPDLVRTGYAAALVALAVSVASGVVGTVATDRMLGVFQEVHTRRRLDVAYWLSVAVVPALLAASTATVAIGVVFALSPLHDVGALGRVITLAAPTIVCGLLMGIMAAGVGVNLPDPYLGATIIATFLPLLTGVIVPLEQCPTWLQALAHLVPVSGTLTVLDAPAAAVPALLGRDLAVAVVWAGSGWLSPVAPSPDSVRVNAPTPSESEEEVCLSMWSHCPRAARHLLRAAHPRQHRGRDPPERQHRLHAPPRGPPVRHGRRQAAPCRPGLPRPGQHSRPRHLAGVP